MSVLPKPRPIVIGAGLGGLLGAALLARRGLRPLVLERLSFCGGKFTHLEYDGFRVPTGAFHSVPGGAYGRLGRLFRELGLRIRYREPRPAGFLYDGKRRFSMPFPVHCILRRDSWLWQLPRRDRIHVARMILVILKTKQPAPDITFGEYVRRYSRSADVLAALDACVRFADGVSLDEVAAQDVVHALRAACGHFHGVIQGGCGEVIRQLLDLLREQGGEVRTGCGARTICVEHGRARGVVDEAGSEHPASLVLCNASPRENVRLLGEACPTALRHLADSLVPACGIAHSIRTSVSIIPHAGGDFPVGFGGRVAGCMQISNSDSSLAPPGMHYILAYQPMGPHEIPAEAVAAGRAEIKTMYPVLRDADFFHTSIFAGSWPAAYVRQSFGQHGQQRIPLAFPELRNVYFLSHSSVGYGLAAEVIGDAAWALAVLLRQRGEFS